MIVNKISGKSILSSRLYYSHSINHKRPRSPPSLRFPPEFVFFGQPNMRIYPDNFFQQTNECPSLILTPPEDSSPCLLHRRLQDQVPSGARVQVPPSHCLSLFPEYQEHQKNCVIPAIKLCPRPRAHLSQPGSDGGIDGRLETSLTENSSR